MNIAQIIAGLIGTGGTPTPPTTPQIDALNAGQGPLSAPAAAAWSNQLAPTTTTSNLTGATQTPGYNANQFGVPLGQQQSNSY